MLKKNLKEITIVNLTIVETNIQTKVASYSTPAQQIKARPKLVEQYKQL